MDLEQTLHMNARRGEYSYANNSSQQVLLIFAQV